MTGLLETNPRSAVTKVSRVRPLLWTVFLGKNAAIVPDLIPFLDQGTPTSAGSITADAWLCDILGVAFRSQPPRTVYWRGSGHGVAVTCSFIASWGLHCPDIRNETVILSFDLFDIDSLLLIVLDVQMYATVSNDHCRSLLTLQWP